MAFCGGFDTTYPGDESGGCCCCFDHPSGIYSWVVVYEYNGGCGIHRRIRYVRFVGVVYITAAVPLLYCADGFEIQRKCGLESSRLCSGWHAHIIHTHTHVHRNNTVRSCHSKTLKYGCCCTMHGFHNVKS